MRQASVLAGMAINAVAVAAQAATTIEK